MTGQPQADAQPQMELRPLLVRLSQSKPDIFFVQIGANDGKRFDPLHECITTYGWKGLLVEPLPDMFTALKATYANLPGLSFENTAIAESAGTKSLLRVDPEKLAGMPDWVAGCATFSERHNQLSARFCPEIRDHVIKQEVSTMTMGELMARHRVTHIDMLQIDTEGYDYVVLSQVDFAKYRPTVINMEFAYLTDEDKKKTRELLERYDYACFPAKLDLIAVQKSFLGA